MKKKVVAEVAVVFIFAALGIVVLWMAANNKSGLEGGIEWKIIHIGDQDLYCLETSDPFGFNCDWEGFHRGEPPYTEAPKNLEFRTSKLQRPRNFRGRC